MAIDLFKPSVPPLKAYQKYLELVDQNRMYSNFGPMQSLLREGLASQFKIPSSCLELFSSGTMALVAAMQGLKKEGRPFCVLPSWTFVATAQAVVASGLVPIFVDVDCESMQLTSSYLGSLPSSLLEQTSVVLVVSPFGAPLNLKGVKKQGELFGFEVLCDCAAGFESIKPNEFHTVISLHATKTFGIGEGGLLMSQNSQLLEVAKAYSNFGFIGSRQSKEFGVNGKLSEFHAAVGLGALDLWSGSREIYYNKANAYRQLMGQSCQFQNDWGQSWVSSTCVIRFTSSSQKKNAQALLSSKNIQSRDWWSQGCHKEPVFVTAQSIGDMSNTDTLATTTLGIPFYRDIDERDIEEIAQSIKGAI